MKPSSASKTGTLRIPLWFEQWELIGPIVAFLFIIPLISHGQENYPNPSNPHGDFSEPMLPPKGIIGVALHLTAERIGDPAGLFIRVSHPAGPAMKAGLTHGQEILAVDGIPIKGKTYREVVEMIRGEVGTSVRLLVKTFSEDREITITRVSEEQLLSQQHT